MKTIFCDLEKWQADYLQKRMTDNRPVCLETSVTEVDPKLAAETEALAVFVYSKVDQNILNKFPNLKIIQSMSTGYDHIDLDECKKRNIVVANVPAYGDNTVAEHAFGLLLNLSRNIHKAYLRSVQEDCFSYEGLMGFDLKGKTLGVIGTGRIGRWLIKIANGFAMNVVAFDNQPQADVAASMGFKYVSLDELYTLADIISLHLPLLPETKHLINKEAIAKMKDGVIIINTSRGGIIATDDLLAGLETGKIAGAGLDVLEGEADIKDETELLRDLKNMPQERLKILVENQALMNMPQVIITPHLAFYSREAMIRIMNTAAETIENFSAGKKLFNQVN
jgi:D-lactate dehydrogenase